MWVNSKTAAAVFGVNHNSIVQAVSRATKQGKKFCSVKCHICHFMYSNGIGRGGKVLQIWIDDEIIANFENTNGVRVSINGISQGCGGGVVDSKSSLVGGLQNANLRVSENGIIQGGVAVMDWGVSANSQNATALNNGISHGVGGASYSENPNSCVSCVVGGRNDNGSVVGRNGVIGANLQGRGDSDFANLHNENLGGSVVSAGSVEVATGGDRNEVSKIEPKQAKRWRTK